MSKNWMTENKSDRVSASSIEDLKTFRADPDDILNQDVSRLQKFIDYSDWLIAVALYLQIYFLPISIALVESSFGLGLFGFFLKRWGIFFQQLKEQSRRNNRLSVTEKIWLFLRVFKPIKSDVNWLMGIFIFIGFLSIFVSHSLVLSIKGFMFKLLEWTFDYFIFIETVSSRRRLKIFLSVFLISAMIALGNGLFQHINGYEFIWHKINADGRVSAAFRHPNDFGGYLIVIIALLFSFVYTYVGYRMKDLKILWGQKNFLCAATTFLFGFGGIALLFLAIACLGWTYSRGAWLAFFTGMIFLGLKKPKHIFIPILMIVAFCLVFSPRMETQRKLTLFNEEMYGEKQPGSPTNYQSHASGAVPEEGMNPSSINAEETAVADSTSLSHFKTWMASWLTHFSGSGRSGYWREAIAIIRQHPILGIGINTYSQIAPGYRITWGGYPHNCYLQMASEIGIPGLIFFRSEEHTSELQSQR